MAAAKSSLTLVQLVESALQLFKLLPSLSELAFSGQVLVVGKVFGGFRNERVEIRRGLGEADSDAPRACSAEAAVALVDDTAPPKSAAFADSKVGPYARRSCRASTTRRNSGIGLRSACR